MWSLFSISVTPWKPEVASAGCVVEIFVAVDINSFEHRMAHDCGHGAPQAVLIHG